MAFITAHRKSGIGFFLLIYRNSFYKFHMMHGRQDWIKLIVSLLVCQLTGVIGSVFTRTAISQWYVLLEKPFFTPPSGLFAPVWIILYMLMGLALFFVWREGIDNRYAKHTVVFFGGQLILNGLWSVLFFGLRSPLAGMVDILLLWIFIVITTRRFFKISRTAGLLMLPYIVWVSFAAVLNGGIWFLNR